VVHNSTLKPIGKAVTLRGINTDKGVVVDTTLEPATQEEIDGTVKVMGGEDWQMWIDALRDADVLAEGAKTTAFTYLGEKLTQDIYWNGSIGEAKKDLDKKVLTLRDNLAALKATPVCRCSRPWSPRPARRSRSCRCTCRCCSR
jgi:enoyl-[acyl-carrier protein] reductase/trans-2-enoyl-CoA reductase (NAD+)